MSSTDIYEFEDSAAAQLPASAESVFDDDVPPAGTPCAGCKSLGHWCPAKCYRGESTALCRSCASGVDCEVVASKLRAAQVAESGEIVLQRFDQPPMPCRSIPVAPGSAVQAAPAASAARLPYTPDPEALRMPKQEVQRERYARPLPQLPPVRIVGKARKLPAPRIAAPRRVNPLRLPEPKKVEEVASVSEFNEVTEEIKEQIRNAPASESNAALAKRLNIAQHNIYYHRKGKGSPSAKAGDAAKDPEPTHCGPSTAIDIVGVAERVHAMAPGTAAARVPESITVSVTLTPAQLDGWFMRLSLAEKAKIALDNITF